MEAHSDAVTAVGYSFIEVVDALDSAGAAFVGLLNDLEPADADLRVPGLEWTVGETAVHMLTVLWRGTIDRRRVDSVAEMGELNALAISEVDERRPSVLADQMEEFLGGYIEALGGIDPARVVKIIGAVRADIPTALSCVLFDLLVHGYDIASATGRDWSIEPAIAALDLRGASQQHHRGSCRTSSTDHAGMSCSASRRPRGHWPRGPEMAASPFGPSPHSTPTPSSTRSRHCSQSPDVALPRIQLPPSSPPGSVLSERRGPSNATREDP